MSRVSQFSLQRIQIKIKRKKVFFFFFNFFGVGVGGGGELAKVIFLTKNPNLQKKIFCPFFWRGWGRGG